MRSFLLVVCFTILIGCSQSTQQKSPNPGAKKTASPVPVVDESHRFPKKDLMETRVVEDHILEKQNLPGGNIARYQSGNKSYELILVKAKSPETAAIWLLDLKGMLTNPAFVASFGGYYGMDGDKPLFLFQKGSYLAGVSGLPQAEADLIAREFATRFN